MSIEGCPRIEDAAGYVLGALPDGEWEAYAAHVDGCAECAAKIAELEFVARVLPNGVPQLEAPPQIGERVMAVVRAEAELLQAAGPQADRPPQPRPARRFGLRLRPWPAAVLASALLGLGIGGGALIVGGGEDDRTLACAQAPAGADCHVRLAGDGATLVVEGLPAPPSGRIYQLWLQRAGADAPQPTEALFSVRRGRASVDVPGDLRGVERVLVTDEPPGGSETPTRPPLIAAPVA